MIEVTTPVSSDAKRWDGYSSALKPSWEPTTGTIMVRAFSPGAGIGEQPGWEARLRRLESTAHPARSRLVRPPLRSEPVKQVEAPAAARDKAEPSC